MAGQDSLPPPSAPTIFRLPDELLEAIVSNLPPRGTLCFGTASKRCNKITFEPLVWRRHCVQTWRYWEARHELREKLLAPPTQTKWRLLFNDRKRVDAEALELFDKMLLSQQCRYERMEKIASHGYDIKDLMTRLRDHTPDDAPDVLARRYYAQAILGQIHRATAVEKWTRLQKRQMVRLEEVLGAFDLFVLSGDKGDLTDIDREFDRLAQCIRDRDPEFEALSTRKKAVQVVKYLRSEGLVGNDNIEDYHALRNNFISMALFDEIHNSLPLQSVAIYCAVARRLGINAKPSNYPAHVHAVIEAPSDRTLDGKFKMPLQGADPDLMHLDPWRSIEEIPLDQLRLRLVQMGAPAHQHASQMGAATMLEIALRTARNIMSSVQEARERQRGVSQHSAYPDVEAAWYSMLWSMLVLGDANSATTLHRRRQCLPYIVEHFQAHFPEDLGLVEKYIPSMFDSTGREFNILLHLVNTARTADRNAKPPNRREERAKCVNFKVGHHFRHKRYGYEGIIIGWDIKCNAEPRWIEQMHVDDLPRGREQPFYNVVADDKNIRYVAEENIQHVMETPCHALLQLAGRYFKRWDEEAGMFVSNVRDEYPDD